MFQKYLKKNFFFNLFFVFLIFLLDRFSKIYVIYINSKLAQDEIYNSKFLNISLIWNEGIAFGLLSFEKQNFYNFITLIIILIIFIIIYMIIKNTGFKRYSLVMILGGAFGNVYDRIVYKAVPDFIDFHVGNFHWFIFNVADIFITLGVIFMIILEIIDNNTKVK
tara:strand:+ start:764 stop:1258 length:495 start_codon:yes stop_codon:yes gene_type:complete